MSKQQSTGTGKKPGGDALAPRPQGSQPGKPRVAGAPAIGSKSARTPQMPEKKINSTGPVTGASTGTRTGSRGGSQTRPRTRAIAPPPKSGFSVRPLDLALVLV